MKNFTLCQMVKYILNEQHRIKTKITYQRTVTMYVFSRKSRKT